MFPTTAQNLPINQATFDRLSSLYRQQTLAQVAIDATVTSLLEVSMLPEGTQALGIAEKEGVPCLIYLLPPEPEQSKAGKPAAGSELPVVLS